MNFITNPINNKKYSILSEKGKKILQKYIHTYLGGAKSDDVGPESDPRTRMTETSRDIRKCFIPDGELCNKTTNCKWNADNNRCYHKNVSPTVDNRWFSFIRYDNNNRNQYEKEYDQYTH